VTTVRLDQLSAATGEIDRAELLDLYRIAVDEVRFEVTLNWQRTQYYFTVNTAVIAVAATILRVSGIEAAPVVAMLFFLGFACARLGQRMIEHGHTYYRRAVYKKTLIERLLGRFQTVGGFDYAGANLGITTTEGMAEITEILEDPDAYINRKPRAGTVTYRLVRLMAVFSIVELVATLLCLGLAASRLLK
jgi:hypothetical protein